jgi:hypothetical protein
MIPTKFALEQSHVDFLEQFKTLGFKDKSSIVRLALDKLHQEIEQNNPHSYMPNYMRKMNNSNSLQIPRSIIGRYE